MIAMARERQRSSLPVEERTIRIIDMASLRPHMESRKEFVGRRGHSRRGDADASEDADEAPVATVDAPPSASHGAVTRSA